SPALRFAPCGLRRPCSRVAKGTSRHSPSLTRVRGVTPRDTYEMVENRDRSLPVPEDMEFQQRAWRAERIAWGVMGIFVLLALLGLFSSGFFSAASTATPDGAVTVDYDRFARKTARSNFSIRIAAPLSAETLVRSEEHTS